MFFVQLLLRLVGLGGGSKSAAQIKKQQILERNRKLHVVMNAMRAHENVRAEAKAQAQGVSNGDKSQSVGESQNIGEALKQSAQQYDQTSVIGKSKEGQAGWRQRTGRSRSVRKRVRRRRERSLTLWR